MDSGESSEEEMTEDADWSPVWASWRAFWTSSVQSFGKGQEEKRGWLKRIEDLVNGNLLEACSAIGAKGLQYTAGSDGSALRYLREPGRQMKIIWLPEF